MTATRHFPVDFNATDVHTGKKGGNKLDQAAAQAIAQQLLDEWKAGGVVLVAAEKHDVAKSGMNPQSVIISTFEPA